MAEFTRYRTEDHALTRVQDSIEAFSREVQSGGIADGRVLEDVVIKTSTVRVPHGLGRRYRGFIVVRRDVEHVVYEDKTSDADRSVYLPLKIKSLSDTVNVSGVATIGSSGSVSSTLKSSDSFDSVSESATGQYTVCFETLHQLGYTQVHFAGAIVEEATDSNDALFAIVDMVGPNPDEARFTILDEDGNTKEPPSGARLHIHLTLFSPTTIIASSNLTANIWVF